jgi:anion-transporting  ArsA/GET3 family ATPase
MDSILKTSKVVIVMGTGGVGKTTLSATIALKASRMGLRTLVLTIDPARRLASALGLEKLDAVERLVQQHENGGALFAAMLDPSQVFSDFVRGTMTDKGAAEKLIANGMYKFLSTTMSGSIEYTALERLYSCTGSGQYDLVVLDTPPAQNAMEFLTAPERFYGLFQDSVLGWFTKASGPGVVNKLLNRGTKVAVGLLETMTGRQFVAELGAFLEAIRELQPLVRDHSIEIQKILSGPTTTFMIVSNLSSAKVKETERLKLQLEKGGYHLRALLINRAFPAWFRSNQDDSPQNQEPASLLYRTLLEDCARVAEEVEELKQPQLRRGASGGYRVFALPQYEFDIVDLESLARVAEDLNDETK